MDKKYLGSNIKYDITLLGFISMMPELEFNVSKAGNDSSFDSSIVLSIIEGRFKGQAFACI